MSYYPSNREERLELARLLDDARRATEKTDGNLSLALWQAWRKVMNDLTTDSHGPQGSA